MTLPLVLHIAGGTSGVVSGFAASFLRKGSRSHGVAGTIFVVSMLMLSVTGTYMALLKHEPGNVMGGSITFYLVVTAWLAARREQSKTSPWDWGALLLVLGVAAFEFSYGTQAAMSPTGMKAGYPPGPYFIFGSVAVIAAIGDIRMLVRGGIFGVQRIARHLWRMCFALFVASASIFLARPQLFPSILQRMGVLYLLTFLPLLLLIFWMIRVRLAPYFRSRRPVVLAAQPSVSAR